MTERREMTEESQGNPRQGQELPTRQKVGRRGPAPLTSMSEPPPSPAVCSGDPWLPWELLCLQLVPSRGRGNEAERQGEPRTALPLSQV